MSYRSFISGLKRLEARIPPWLYLAAGGILLYSHSIADSWTRLAAVILLIPFATIFVGVSGLILNASGILLASVLSTIIALAILF